MYQINHKRPPRFSSPRKSTPEPGSTEASLLKELQKLTSALGQVRSREGREVQAHQAALLEDAQGGDARVSSAQSDAATTAPPSREAGSARAAHLLFVRRVLFPKNYTTRQFTNGLQLQTSPCSRKERSINAIP